MNTPLLIQRPRPVDAGKPRAPKPRRTRKSSQQGARPFNYFIWCGGLVFVFLMATNTTLFCVVLAPEEKFFFNIAAAMVVSWTVILTLYYVWAIYFYNISGGRTGKDLDEPDQKKAAPTDERFRERNPNSDATLGLPPGTVRGTLALSVLVVAMAMMIASLAMPRSMKQNEIVIDHLEFLKTGFVMVIAFYFGTKSLEILRQQKKDSDRKPQSES